MVFENDPFEDFKRQRQIEIIEKKFNRKARARSQELNDLVRKGSPDKDTASRIHQEMQEFFSDSQQHISKLINQSDHPDSISLEKKVNEEMADFFRTSTETAKDLLGNLCDSSAQNPEATERMVDHLDSVFEQSMARISEVRRKYSSHLSGTRNTLDTMDPPGPSHDSTQNITETNRTEDRIQQLKDVALGPPLPVKPTPASEETAAHQEATALVQTTQPQPLSTQGMESEPQHQPQTENPSQVRVDPEGLEEEQAGQRILKRQNHLPGSGARKRGLTLLELGELRALKELLIQKGLITREELAEKMATTQ